MGEQSTSNNLKLYHLQDGEWIEVGDFVEIPPLEDDGPETVEAIPLSEANHIELTIALHGLDRLRYKVWLWKVKLRTWWATRKYRRAVKKYVKLDKQKGA